MSETFWPWTATATFCRTPTSFISGPRRARPGPAQVTTCAALTKSVVLVLTP